MRCEIELAPGGAFRLIVPNEPGKDKSLTYPLIIPATPGGMRTMRRILADRAVATHAKVGHDASPTQQMVDAWLNAHRPTDELNLNLEGFTL